MQEPKVSRRKIIGGVAAMAIPSIAQGKAIAVPTVLGRNDGVWLNAPRRWQADANGDLTLTTDRATDFWRETHYGFTRDSGHFLGFPTLAAFTAQMRIRGDYQKLYDQAGIMIRLDERRWIKAGIELSDGRAMLSSVLTDGRSDWATSPYAHDPTISGRAPPSRTVCYGFRCRQMGRHGHSCGSRRFRLRRRIGLARWSAPPSARDWTCGSPNCASRGRSAKTCTT
ncbi:DUF1349 domain-containing protein [Sphingomonas sp. I4]